ncbi:hypothetical protein ABZ805_17615 [Saccharopolyspora sp. NPDC047091]|uniref:hypothetical protein n=1 Tax=Saccharopolyspora sp. NPDC047091 TaxID=3155924 RepID=UPI0033C753F1
MINPGAIPQIPGDMGALSAHAAGVGTAGTGIADTGSDVHANWQALAPAYTAPESGQLLQATAPVAQVAGNIGRDVEQVSGALKAYADEVRPIQQRLRDLKAQAEQLVADIHSYENQKPSNSELAASAKTGIVPDKDWTDDGDLVDRDAHIMSAVNQAVADWMAAQRRCANTITALYGGTHYTADNADGHQAAGEYGYTADQLTAAAGSDEGLPWGKTEDTGNPLSDIGHFVLDLGGLIPGIGELADGANASWYAAEGDYTNAGLSAAAMIPFAGWGATGGKLLGKGAKVVSEGGQEAAEATAKNINAADSVTGVPLKNVDGRAQELQNTLPENTRGRVTIGFGVGRDADGNVRNVVGSSERNGYLRKPVAEALQDGDEVANVHGTMHAEQRILSYMERESITPGSVGAGRPICNQCEPIIRDAGAQPASPLKGAPPRGQSP